jgi:hypothetical protein
VIALKIRVKIMFLVALTTFAAVSGGGFFDQWFKW